MIVIGLTGGIASGKSTAAALLRHANIPVIDADHLARLAVDIGSDGLGQIVDIFGPEILMPDLSLNRAMLGQIIFKDPKSLKKLEDILHPEIRRLCLMELNSLRRAGHKVAVYMAPLLFEKDLHHEMDKTLLIVADESLRRARMSVRDHLSLDEIENRLNAQLRDNIKIPLADEIVINNGTKSELYKNLSYAWQRLTNMKLPSRYHDLLDDT
jgi:dephospho-CoA kinase